MTDEAMKVHLRVYELRHQTLRVVTLRPQTQARISTNHYHDTWHMLAGPYGATVLGRLMYGLAFQKQAGTVVLIDEPHLVPTPFEADPAYPVLLVCDDLARIDIDTVKALKLQMRRAPRPPTTIRWHTFGMPADLEDDRRRKRWEDRPILHRERTTNMAGMIVYTAPRTIMKQSGLGIHSMHDGMDGAYLPLGETNRSWWTMEGEFQIIADFDDDVATARRARNDVLAGQPRPQLTEDERFAIWNRKGALDRRRRRRPQP